MCKSGTTIDVSLLKQKLFSGRREIPVDACIAPLVKVLNSFGIETIACCCGHGETAKSHVKISAKNVLLVRTADDFSIRLVFPYRGPKEKK